MEWKEFLPGSSLSHLGLRSRNNDLSYCSGACIVATTSVSMELLPCAASSTWTWVNQLLTLVQWLGWCRTTTYYNFETWSHLGHLFARFAMTSWKKYWAAWGFLFWKRSVSPSPLGVFLVCFGFVFGWVCLFWIWKTPGFLLSPILQYVGIANQWQNVFDDRQSLERARHELKKKAVVQQRWKLDCSDLEKRAPNFS